VEGKIFVRLDHAKNSQIWQLIVGCNLPGKWILHWGVSYVNDVGRYTFYLDYLRRLHRIQVRFLEY
jgi:hypothetical protein